MWGQRMKRLVLMAVMVSASAFAQEGGGEDGARYSKTTTINFEDDTIEGDLTRPDGEYLESRGRVKHSNLIRIREEFKDKVMQSVGEL